MPFDPQHMASAMAGLLRTVHSALPSLPLSPFLSAMPYAVLLADLHPHLALDLAWTSGLYKRPLIINTKQAGALSVAPF